MIYFDEIGHYTRVCLRRGSPASVGKSPVRTASLLKVICAATLRTPQPLEIVSSGLAAPAGEVNIRAGKIRRMECRAHELFEEGGSGLPTAQRQPI